MSCSRYSPVDLDKFVPVLTRLILNQSSPTFQILNYLPFTTPSYYSSLTFCKILSPNFMTMPFTTNLDIFTTLLQYVPRVTNISHSFIYRKNPTVRTILVYLVTDGGSMKMANINKINFPTREITVRWNRGGHDQCTAPLETSWHAVCLVLV
jgi:hypothetical protein